MTAGCRRLRNWCRTLTREVCRGWEPERMLYSLVVAAVALAHVWQSWLTLEDWVRMDDAFFRVLAIAYVVNLGFCAAYFVDPFVQSLRQHAARRQWRYLVISIRFVLAIGSAHIAMLALFTPSHPVQ